LTDWLCYIGNAVGGTAIFQSRAKIPEIVVRTPIEIANNPRRQIRLLEEAAGRHIGTSREILINIARAYYIGSNGDRSSAQALLSDIDISQFSDLWAYDLEWNLAAARQELGN